MSYNKWAYVYGNPVSLMDPSGRNPNCEWSLGPAYKIMCAEQRFFEIVSGDPRTAGQNALALVTLFEDQELQMTWGDIAGRTLSKRLEWILSMTRGQKGADILGMPVHFRLNRLFGYNDCWFSEELRDNQFYRDRWSGNSFSNQVGHFLTAVDLGYGYSDLTELKLYIGDEDVVLQLIIGHELLDDGDLARQLDVDISSVKQNFLDAVDADASGDKQERDQLLWEILGFDRSFDPNYVDPDRIGNSLQDLRLSIKGYRFGKWVYANPALLPIRGAQWLRKNILVGTSKRVR